MSVPGTGISLSRLRLSLAQYKSLARRLGPREIQILSAASFRLSSMVSRGRGLLALRVRLGDEVPPASLLFH